MAPAFAPTAQDAQEGKEGFRDEQQQQQQQKNHRQQRRAVIPVDFSDQGSVSDTVVGGLEGFPTTMPSRATASYADRSAASRPPPGPGPIPAAGKRGGRAGEKEVAGRSSACCGLGEKIKRWASLVPMDKLKILVVVWQILTVFPSITGADFPPAYARFLSWIDIVNLDVGSIFSGTCLLPRVSFYERLLLTTLAPLGLAAVLVVTFQLAKRRAGIGSASVISRRAAWSRHMAAGLLLTFLVRVAPAELVSAGFSSSGIHASVDVFSGPYAHTPPAVDCERQAPATMLSPRRGKGEGVLSVVSSGRIARGQQRTNPARRQHHSCSCSRLLPLPLLPDTCRFSPRHRRSFSRYASVLLRKFLELVFRI